MSTGTFAPASLDKRSRTACISSVRPKTIVSGGISPRGWTSVLRLLVVMVGRYQPGRTCYKHPENQKGTSPLCPYTNLLYVIGEHQLTKELSEETLVIKIWTQA